MAYVLIIQTGTSDPGFADYENGNFELSQEARALAEGFPSIVMSSFGTLK